MLSSQRHILFRAGRRKISDRQALVSIQQQQHQQQQSLAAFSSLPSVPAGTDEDDTPTGSPRTARCLPLIQPLAGRNALLSRSVLERAYPLGIGRYPGVFWFSSSAATKDETKLERSSTTSTIGERASAYSSKAQAGARSFGGMMTKYGPAFVVTYLSVYVTNLSLFYLGIESGALDPVTLLGYITDNTSGSNNTAEVVSELLEHYTITAPFAETVKTKPNLANFAIAWISTKFTEPIRFGLSVAIVPRVAKMMGITPKEGDEATEETVVDEESQEKKEEKKDGPN